jgi:biotin transporter BioY
VIVTTTGRWAPGIGDPTWGGWSTVLMYVLAAAACGWAARSSPARTVVARLWWVLMAGLLFLGLNKQLDLQSWLTQFGREMARAQGWYDVHRAVQAAFIAVLGLVIVYAVGFALWLLRDEARAEKGAVAGMLVLGGYILMRAASFHHVDALLGAHWGGLRFNWIFENTGIAIIAFHAMLRGLHKLRPSGRLPPDFHRHGPVDPTTTFPPRR